jgi:drug/metabolite transporter (DMT)-like permease
VEKVQFDPARRIYGILYAGTTALMWGFLAILIKVTTVDVDAVTIVWFRFVVAFLPLAAYFVLRDAGKLKILYRPPGMLLIAAIALTINYIGFAKGIFYTSPGNAQVFIQFGPVLLAVSGILFFHERLSIRQFSGFLVTAAGFFLFYRDQLGHLPGKEELYIAGVAWLVLSAVSWAAYAALQKRLVQRIHAQQLNLFLYGLPALVLIPFIQFQAFAGFSWVIWVLLVTMGINTLVAYGCLAESFKYLEANKVSVIIMLNPIITFILMAIFGSMKVRWIEAEYLTIFSLLGAALVLSGAFMVVLPKRMKSFRKASASAAS